MQMQGTQWYPHGWMLSEPVIMHPGQDSHTKCVTVLPLRRQNHQGSHGADQAGIQVYKKCAPITSRNHSCCPIWATDRQDYTRVGVTTKQNTHTWNTHKQVVQIWHRQIPCAVKKWKSLHHGSLSFFQCDFSCSLKNNKIPTQTRRIQLNHEVPKEQRPDYRLAKFIQWSK